jgi:hypothetical protein
MPAAPDDRSTPFDVHLELFIADRGSQRQLRAVFAQAASSRRCTLSAEHGQFDREAVDVMMCSQSGRNLEDIDALSSAQR